MLPEKSDYFPNERTAGRTDGTHGFDLPTDVKSASRKNLNKAQTPENPTPDQVEKRFDLLYSRRLQNRKLLSKFNHFAPKSEF